MLIRIVASSYVIAKIHSGLAHPSIFSTLQLLDYRQGTENSWDNTKFPSRSSGAAGSRPVTNPAGRAARTGSREVVNIGDDLKGGTCSVEGPPRVPLIPQRESPRAFRRCPSLNLERANGFEPRFTVQNRGESRETVLEHRRLGTKSGAMVQSGFLTADTLDCGTRVLRLCPCSPAVSPLRASLHSNVVPDWPASGEKLWCQLRWLGSSHSATLAGASRCSPTG